MPFQRPAVVKRNLVRLVLKLVLKLFFATGFKILFELVLEICLRNWFCDWFWGFGVLKIEIGKMGVKGPKKNEVMMIEDVSNL